MLAVPDGLELVLEVLLLKGERTSAHSLAAAHAQRLSTTTRGVTLLELLGLGTEVVWLPNGRANLVGLSRRIADGVLKAGALARLVGVAPGSWLRTPELHLLFFEALRSAEPERALRFLNRYFRLHGLPRCREANGAAMNWLSSIEFDSPEVAAPGPLVSVVVAARNARDTIGYAIDSLLRQSYERLEILVCDDDSDDDTLEHLRSRYAHTARVRLFRSAGNQGAYNVRNALLREAQGQLLTFHDADDYALPNRIAIQVDAMQYRGTVACVVNWLRVTPAGSIVFFKNQQASRLSRVSLMLTREAFGAVGPFRSALEGADLELHADLVEHFGPGAIARLKRPLILGLWSESSATRRRGSEALEDGYRSASRRLYSELVALKHARVQTSPGDQEIELRLREIGNYAEPRPVLKVRS
jgi:hypothetical protein